MTKNKVRTSTRLLFSWAGKFIWSLLSTILVLTCLGIFIFIKARSGFFTYIWLICIPFLVALSSIIVFLYTSKYIKISADLFLKRKAFKKAGLAFISSISGKILLNLQKQAPWENMWCLPGGYFNPSKGDRFLHTTAERRVKELLGDNCSLIYRGEAAKTNDSPHYITLVLEKGGHEPIEDILYFFLKPDDTRVAEEDVIEREDLRWFTSDDIESDRYPIAPHMKEIILYLLQSPQNADLRCWELSRESESFILQQTI